MSILVLTSDTLIGTAATGNLEYNGQFFGTDSNASRAQMQRIVLSTAVASTSGTSIDFTSIPAFVKRITVMLNGVSTSGTSVSIIQLGDAGGIETTGYLGAATNNGAAANFTTGIALSNAAAATNIRHGSIVISSIGSNSWSAFGCISQSESAAGGTTAFSKTLSDTLTQVRITTVNGTDTFDAGSINLLLEG